MLNKKFTLAGRPIGRPISDDDFDYKEEELRDLNDGEFCILKKDQVEFFDSKGNKINKKILKLSLIHI